MDKVAEYLQRNTFGADESLIHLQQLEAAIIEKKNDFDIGLETIRVGTIIHLLYLLESKSILC